MEERKHGRGKDEVQEEQTKCKRVISSAKEKKQKEWANDLNDSECQNKIFRMTKQIVKEHPPRLTAPFPGLPGWAGTRKVKPIWILLKQETVSGSGIS